MENKLLKGFTLMEIIVVIGLSILIILVIYSSYLISSSAFYTSDNRLELIQNGRVFLDRITRELRQSVEIVTNLPPNKTDPLSPPPNEIIFQDGHDLETIQYLRYYVDNALIKKQRIVYFFAAEPAVYVYWNAIDQFGNPPQSQILEDKIIAEFITNLLFYGSTSIKIDVYLTKKQSTLHLYTEIYGRNKR